MRTLFQWCNTCNTETVFNYDSVTCTVCKKVCANYKSKENVTNGTNTQQVKTTRVAKD